MQRLENSPLAHDVTPGCRKEKGWWVHSMSLSPEAQLAFRWWPEPAMLELFLFPKGPLVVSRRLSSGLLGPDRGLVPHPLLWRALLAS